MLSRSLSTPCLGLLLAVGIGACVPDGSSLETGEGDEVLGGTVSLDRPEIGSIGGCTATLIRPRVAITAAHCMNYATRETPGRYGTFTIQQADRSTTRYTIERYRSFGRQLGANDVTLLRLATAVPPEIATPTTVALDEPARGETASIWGYGCTRRGSSQGGGTKRFFAFPYGPSSNLCPGDSGGPMVHGMDGPVFGINSGYYTNNGRDIFGAPWQIRTQIEQQLASWGDGPLAPPDAPPGGGAPPPGGEAPPPETAPTPPGEQAPPPPPGDQTPPPGGEVPPPSGPPPPPPPPPPTDCLGAEDAAGATSPAPTPASGGVCRDRDSWLLVPLEPGDTVVATVRFSHARGDVDVSFHGPTGTELARSEGQSDEEVISYTTRLGGDFRLRVFGWRGAENDVSVELSIRP